MRKLLLPFSLFFATIVFLRNFLYDKRLLKIKRINKPVISIGNISVGGTGKTPVIEMLIEYLQKNGKRVAVISRGYKRKSRKPILVSDGNNLLSDYNNSGDEPFQIARKYKNVIVGVDRNRARIAEFINSKFNIDVFLLDDAFQHRKIHRDLDIVNIDGSTDPFKDYLLPAGNLRETYNSLKRSDLVHVTKSNIQNFDMIQKKILNIKNIPVFKVDYEISILENYYKNIINIANLRENKIVLFCGIANSDYLINQLNQKGLTIVKSFVFKDHYNYKKKDLQKIIKYAEDNCINHVITTEKDFIRLLCLFNGFNKEQNEKIYFLKLEKSIQNCEEYFKIIDKYITYE